MNDSGETYVIYGSGSYSAGKIFDLYFVSANITVYGNDAYDYSGAAVASGNVNDDDFDDIIIGAYLADPPGGTDAGETYVIYGADYPTGKIFDLNLGSVSANITVQGDDYIDWSGYSVASGDINNDNIADIIIGAYKGNGTDESLNDTGETYVIYGADYSFNKTFNLDSVWANITIWGNDAYDYSGAAVASGNITNVGMTDIIIGAPLADPTGGADAGETYVIFGSNDFPYFTSHSNNQTYPKYNENINLSIDINDDRDVDYIWFSTNDSGSWTNYSFKPSATTLHQNWTILKVASSKDSTAGYAWYANDTASNLNKSKNSTGAYYFFKVQNTAPTTPYLNSPLNGSTGNSLTVTLKLNGSTDADSDTLFFWYSINNTLYGSSQNYTYTPSSADYYNWTALSSDNSTNSSWASTYYFTIAQDVVEEEVEEKVPGVSYRGSTGPALPSKREFTITPGLMSVTNFPPDSTLESIELNVLSATENAKLIAQEIPEVNVPEINAYTFLEILAFNIYFDKAAITFKVDNNWIISSNIEEDSITLMLFDSIWIPLTTEKMFSFQGYTYFKTETSRFGVFGVTGQAKLFEPIKEVEKTIPAISEITPSVTKEIPKKEVIQILNKIKEQKIVYMVAIGVILITFALLILTSLIRKKEKRKLRKIRKLISQNKFEKAEKFYKKTPGQEDINYVLTEYEIQKENKERQSRLFLKAAEKRIEQAIEEGYTEKQIVEAFLQKGWDKKVIKNLISKFRS